MSNALTLEIETRCLELGEIDAGAGEEEVRYLNDRFVNGRKPYRCAHCWRVIEVGERHRSVRVVVDGEVGGCRYCAECCVAQSEESEVYDDRLVNRYMLARTLEGFCDWLAGAEGGGR